MKIRGEVLSATQRFEFKNQVGRLLRMRKAKCRFKKGQI